MSEEKNNTLIVILRWIAFVPVAFIAQLFTVFGNIIMINFVVGSSGLYSILTKLVISFLSGAAFIYAGTLCAPSHRKYVIIFLLVLFVAFSIYGFTLGNPYVTKTISLMDVIVGVIGAVIASISLYKECDNEY